MIDYLIQIIEHDVPPPNERDEGEMQGAFYLRENIRRARELSAALRDEPRLGQPTYDPIPILRAAAFPPVF